MKKISPRSLSFLSLLLGVAFSNAFILTGTAANAQDQGTVSAIGPVPDVSAPIAAEGEAMESIQPQPDVVAAEDGGGLVLTPETNTPSNNSSSDGSGPVIVNADMPAPPPPQNTDALVAPADGGLIPLPEEASGDISGTNVMGESGVPQQHSGTFYDSRVIVPDSQLSSSGVTGPRKVDPAYEPGQKYVIVEPGPKAGSFEGQYVAAVRALKLGRYAAAMEMFEKLYKRNHKDPRILMGLAVAQQGAGFSQSAAQTYEDLLKLQPNNADAIVNLMGIMKSQYPSVTLKKLMELRNKYPSNPGIPAQIGLVSAELQNYDDAIRYFEVAASMEPTNPSHIFNMAVVVDKKGDVSQAIKLYERALQLDATYGSSANNLSREQIYDRLVVLRRKV